MIDFLSQIEILLFNMLKLLNIPGFQSFFSDFRSKFFFPGFEDFWQPCLELSF